MTLKLQAHAMALAIVTVLLIGTYAQAQGPVKPLPVFVQPPGATAGTVPVWAGTTPTQTLSQTSEIVQSSGNIGIGTSTPVAKLDVNGKINTNAEYDIGGNRVLAVVGLGGTAVGIGTLRFNTGNANTAVGRDALEANTTGNGNTALGFTALLDNSTGSSNTAVGAGALEENRADENTGIGAQALAINQTGNANTAIGFRALHTIRGSNNIGIGHSAGFALTIGNHNIDIGNEGVAGESGVIRIGKLSDQTQTFIAGISNNPNPIAGSFVLVDADGQLGIVVSSRQVKDEIRDMGAASGGLLRLRPVTFRYKQGLADGSRPRQYGLIAEEVADVYPELVAYDPKTGEPQTVLYHELPAMLLNEVQRQQRQLETQARQMESQAAELTALRARLATLETAMAGPGLRPAAALVGSREDASVPR